MAPPTPAPTNANTAQPQDAVFDSEYGAPRCINAGSKCDSLNLLNGRGTIANGMEPNFRTRMKRETHVLTAATDRIMVMNQSIKLPLLLVILYQEPQFHLVTLLLRVVAHTYP
jgi:hypothetical protein